MITKTCNCFHTAIIFLLVSIFGISGFSAKISWAGDDVNLPEIPGLLSSIQPSCESLPEIIENGYQRVYTTVTVPVTVEQLEEMRKSGKTPDIDPETGGQIIESFKDYLPENWQSESSKSEVLTDSYGNQIVNQTPGLPGWAQRDVDALRLEIENSIEQYWNANASGLEEIGWLLGNFIGQAIVRKIEFKDLVELGSRDLVSDDVADSIMEYLHFYENLKYSRSLSGKFTYSVSEYDSSIEEFVKSRSQTLDQVVMLENPNEGTESLRGETPSGCYSRSIFTRGMTSLTKVAVIWNGADLLFPNDASADIPIGFNFVFYGCEDYDCNTHVRVSTNGYISFYQQGGGAVDGIDHSNDSITSSTDPDGYVAAWWDDMIVNNQGTTDKVIYKTEGAAPDREFTVQYSSISRYSGSSSDEHYFQIKLFEADGSIEFHYGDWVAEMADNATIGIENYAGTDGDCGPSCGNTNSVRPPSNYRFIPRYNIWYGWIDSAWDNVNNWEPKRLPTNTISAIIPNRSNDPSVNSEEFCYTLNVLSGAVLTMPNAQINVYGNIINNGTIQNLGALYTDIIVRGDCTISGNGNWLDLDFEIGTSTTNLVTSFETRSFTCSRRAVFNTGGNTITTTKGLYNSGTINAGNTHWCLGGSYLGELGIFNAGTSVVDLNGSFNSEIYDSPTFYVMDVNKFGGAIVWLLDDLDVSYKVNVYGGTLLLYRHSLSAAESHIYSILNNQGVLTLTGSGLFFYSGANYLCSIGEIDSAGHVKFMGGSDETITGGTISLEGDFVATNGNFTPSGGTVVFDGSSESGIYGSPSFFDMSVDKSAAVTFAEADFSVTNSLSLVSGIFEPNGYTVTVGE